MTEKELLCFLLVIFKHVRNLGANTTSPFKLHLNKAEYRKISSTERTTEINLGWPKYSGTIESIFTEEVSYLVCSCPPLKRYRDLFRKLPLKALKIVKEV